MKKGGKKKGKVDKSFAILGILMEICLGLSPIWTDDLFLCGYGLGLFVATMFAVSMQIRHMKELESKEKFHSGRIKNLQDVRDRYGDDSLFGKNICKKMFDPEFRKQIGDNNTEIFQTYPLKDGGIEVMTSTHIAHFDKDGNLTEIVKRAKFSDGSPITGMAMSREILDDDE